MRQDIWYDSKGAGSIHACRWLPEEEPKAVFQIVHGIAEFVERYDAFARYLTGRGYAVVAEDHMGHGQSVGQEGIRGYFHGGWFAAVEDTMQLMNDTMVAFPGVPYVLFGHSMGSFMARTILCKYPDSGISAAVICGTGWQPAFALPACIRLVEAICQKNGQTNTSELLQTLIFGSYNKRIEHPRTRFDWLSRDKRVVDAYIAHPLCGFTPTCGLVRDLMKGIHYIEQPENLANMKKDLPVFFVAGQEDPVGSYGKGVLRCGEAFRKAGMTAVSVKLYPLCRHEILNEINREEVWNDVAHWVEKRLEASN